MILTLTTGKTFQVLSRLDNGRASLKGKRPAVAVLELAVATGIIAFWTAYFATDMVTISDSRLEEVYRAFESAFPVADLYLAGVLIIGAAGLLRRRPYGHAFSLMGGASLIFLGLLDVSFNLQQGIYLLGAGEAALNIAINAACLGFGSFLAISVLKSRRRPAHPRCPLVWQGAGLVSRGGLS